MAASLRVRKVHHNQAGSRIKSEPQTRGAQLPNSNWLQERGDLLEGHRDPGHRNENRSKDLSDWTQEIRSHQFTLSLTLSLLSSLILSA